MLAPGRRPPLAGARGGRGPTGAQMSGLSADSSETSMFRPSAAGAWPRAWAGSSEVCFQCFKVLLQDVKVMACHIILY